MRDVKIDNIESISFNGKASHMKDVYTCSVSFLRTLIYFDIFSYPLSRKELFEYSSLKEIELMTADSAIKNLLDKSIISYSSGFYFLGNNPDKVAYRREGNLLAAKRMKAARKYSRIIASFPFVRGVYISGSLSKGYMNDDSDIDYFIITEPSKLWLSRTFLILFKKIFLLNSHKNFCINYLVDKNHLTIAEENIFTATEIAFLLPMYNLELFKSFLKTNSWHLKYYPNYKQNYKDLIHSYQGVKKASEFLLNNNFGNRLDNFFLKITLRYWKKKHGKSASNNTFEEFSCSKSVAQYNPEKFHQSILNKFEERLLLYESLSGLNLNGG